MNIPAALYYPVFIYSLAAISLVVGVRDIASPGYERQEKGAPGFLLPLLVSVVYAVFLGTRPYTAYVFGDSNNYARSFAILDVEDFHINLSGEWLWDLMMYSFKTLHLDVSDFFLFVSLCYFLFVLFAIKIVMPRNPMLALLFTFTSLMFYSFGINGLRNGLACHITLFGIALALDGKLPVSAILFVAAYSIHHSVVLPVASVVAALYFLKDIRISLWIWLLSIPLSLVSGNFFMNFFSGLGFDDRMAQYSEQIHQDLFSSTGFRWDFLAFSCAPVVMAWYVCVKKRISDNWYNVICAVYLICNALWILVIRSSYSNRFAYLSWFIYPFVIAYPLIMLPLWRKQDQMVGMILIVYVAFTLIMSYLWSML